MKEYLLPIRAIKGRGAASRIAHRFEGVQRNTFDDGWGGDVSTDSVTPTIATQVFWEDAKSIITHNDSPDIYFDNSLNPYRGCEHGCVYCYARPTHSFLGLSPGLDFETKIIAKRNIAAVLRAELAKPSYRPSLIAIGTATDCYQPVERDLQLTRAVIELFYETHHPLGLVTKSSGVERDLDLITPMAARNLAAQGIPVGVSLAPQIPFLNEDMEQVLEAAWDAGARTAFYTVLRLPWELKDVFKEWLEIHYPLRAARIMARIHDMRSGKDYDADFATRMKGRGLWAELIRNAF